MPDIPLPRVVKIGPHAVAIDVHSASRLRAEHRLGDSSCATLRISIDTEVAESVLAETLLHELLHVLIGTAGIDLGEKEEQVVAGISPWLLGVLRDNPGLLELLADRRFRER